MVHAIVQENGGYKTSPLCITGIATIWRFATIHCSTLQKLASTHLNFSIRSTLSVSLSKVPRLTSTVYSLSILFLITEQALLSGNASPYRDASCRRQTPTTVFLVKGALDRVLHVKWVADSSGVEQPAAKHSLNEANVFA
jgi:hypothetical protein